MTPTDTAAIKLPDAVNILGIQYSIEYVDNPADVDLYKRKSLWGQIDYWTRTIRVYRNQRPIEDVWQTILHEVLHGVAEALHIKGLSGDDPDEDAIDLIAVALGDILIRNGWLVVEQTS